MLPAAHALAAEIALALVSTPRAALVTLDQVVAFQRWAAGPTLPAVTACRA